MSVSPAGFSPISLPAVRHGDTWSIKDSPTENSEERSTNCHLIAMTWKSSKENRQNLVSPQNCETESKCCFNPQSLLQHIQDTHTRFKMGEQNENILFICFMLCAYKMYTVLWICCSLGGSPFLTWIFSDEFEFEWAMNLLNNKYVCLGLEHGISLPFFLTNLNGFMDEGLHFHRAI